tara:strand:- start:2835 stop:5510 length:2676 start_codon:yes stop_codon:yes gene_type:complete
MPHTPGHSPFDFYALRGEGGEETTSMDIMRRRAQEQARNFTLAPEPPQSPAQQFESSMANAAAQQQQQFEELERQRREAEQRAQELARLQDIENRLAQMQAATPPAPPPAPAPAPPPQFTPTPSGPQNVMVDSPRGAVDPPPIEGLIDPRDVASQQFTDIGESIISSEGQLFGNLIREALDNGKNVYSPTALGMRQDVFGFGGLSQYEQFNKLLEIEQRQGNTIADVLFKFTGTGPNTEVGRALSLLAQANGNLSGLPARERELLNAYQVQNGQIPDATLRLYGIPTGGMTPSDVVGGAPSTEMQLGPLQDAGTGTGQTPGQAVGAGGAEGLRTTLDAGQEAAIFQRGFDTIESLRAGNTSARLPNEIFQLAADDDANGREGTTAQNIVQAFLGALDPSEGVTVANITADVQERQQDIERDLRSREINIAQQNAQNTLTQISSQFQVELGDLELRQLAQAQQNQIQQSRLAFDERNARATRELEKELSIASNRNAKDIANIQSEATRFVATENGLAARDVALFNKASATEVAEITGLSKAQVANIQGQYNRQVASLTGLSQQEVARIQGANQLAVEKERLSSQETISDTQLANAIKLAGINNTSTAEIAEAQNEAAIKVATANNTSASEIAKLQGDDAYRLSQMQISEQFKGEAEIAKLQSQYQKELATLTGSTQEEIATIQAQSNEDINDARIAGEKEAYTAQQQFQSQEAIAQRDFESGEAGAQRTFQQQQAQLDRDAQAENVRLQFLNGLQPAEFAELQRDIARGGLSVEQSENLAALVARGGLTPEERIAEMSAESRSDEMNAFISLLSNPQALGAFVTAISGQLPFETVPTMGQLAEMTPNRIQYLQGALSALGIDPSTFVRMAQSVTPQAFQDTGPFSQITAMVS